MSKHGVESVPVASLIEDGGLYVVMAKTHPGRVPGGEPGLKLTTLTVMRLSASLGMVMLEEGERVHQVELLTLYAALPPFGGLFWQYAGRRLLDECVKQRPLTQSQVLGYEARYQECRQDIAEVPNG